jgi:outer membrane protein assembly factor BamB
VTGTPQGPGGGGGGATGIGSGASPTIGADGTVYIGANNSNLYAVAPDGSMKWLFEAERELAGIWTTPVLSADGGTLYFGANKGGIYALNTVDGSRRWQFPVYGSIYASSVLDSPGVLYTGTTIEHVYAIDSASGEPLWDLDIHNQVWSAPSIRRWNPRHRGPCWAHPGDRIAANKRGRSRSARVRYAPEPWLRE